MQKDENFVEDNITRILNDPEKVRDIIQLGINKALLEHQQAGNEVCVWRDDRVVWVAAEKIFIDE